MIMIGGIRSDCNLQRIKSLKLYPNKIRTLDRFMPLKRHLTPPQNDDGRWRLVQASNLRPYVRPLPFGTLRALWAKCSRHSSGHGLFEPCLIYPASLFFAEVPVRDRTEGRTMSQMSDNRISTTAGASLVTRVGLAQDWLAIQIGHRPASSHQVVSASYQQSQHLYSTLHYLYFETSRYVLGTSYRAATADAAALGVLTSATRCSSSAQTTISNQTVSNQGRKAGSHRQPFFL